MTERAMVVAMIRAGVAGLVVLAGGLVGLGFAIGRRRT